MGTKLFVGNLSFNTTQNQLQDAFSQHGVVVERGPKAALFADPREDYTNLLLSSVPEMDPDWLNRLLADRPQFAPAVMAVVVCHGWCPWTSANPGVTVEVLHTATWAARGRFAGWNSPHVLSFLPMCTCHECAADHARFDRRVLCCADVPAYCGYFTESD